MTADRVAVSAVDRAGAFARHPGSWWQPAGIALAAVVAWTSAFPGAFQFDDFRVVVANPDVHSFGAWLASMPGMRALTKLSYAVNWQIDPRARGFVAFGLACHVANAWMVLYLARSWLADIAPRVERPETAAVVAALVFALHPAQTEAVTYVAGRSVVLSTLFVFASLCAWERSRRGNAVRGAGRSRKKSSLTPLILFLMAMGARETAVVLPALLVLREIAAGASLRDALARTRWYWCALVAGVVGLLALPGYRRLIASSLDFRAPLDSLAMQPSALLHLVTHPLLTLRLSIDPAVAQPAVGEVRWWLALVVVAGTIALGCAMLRRVPLVGFGLLWFLLVLAPVFGPLARFDPANDRQLYLSVVGPALLAGALLATIPLRGLRVGLIAGLVVVLGATTSMRNADYRSEVRLWEATARTSPGKARVWNNLGYAYVQAGEHALARAVFERALALDPEDYKARENLRDLTRN